MSVAEMRIRESGFSLLELMAVLLITSILLGFSVSIGKLFLAENRTVAAVNTLMSGLYYARSEAIGRGEKITFCKSRDEKSCSGEWSDGQIIVDSKGDVLRVFPGLPSSDKFIWLSGLGKNDALDWWPTGYADQRGSFYYCARSSVKASRVIVVLHTGRLYSVDMSSVDYARVCENN